MLGGPDQYFDPTSFVPQPNGTLGDVARNAIRGPGFASVDFAVTKNTQQLGSEARNSPQNHSELDNRKADRGHSNFDIRHNFVANATFDLPFGQGQQVGGGTRGLASFLISGWQLNGVPCLTTQLLGAIINRVGVGIGELVLQVIAESPVETHL